MLLVYYFTLHLITIHIRNSHYIKYYKKICSKVLPTALNDPLNAQVSAKHGRDKFLRPDNPMGGVSVAPRDVTRTHIYAPGLPDTNQRHNAQFIFSIW